MLIALAWVYMYMTLSAIENEDTKSVSETTHNAGFTNQRIPVESWQNASMFRLDNYHRSGIGGDMPTNEPKRNVHICIRAHH